MASDGDEAPGWDAIDAAVAQVVGGVEPLHWGTGTGLPDQGGLWGISAYRLPDHWFLVTYGLSELFTKVRDNLTVSGWGEEFTMRIAAVSDDPPLAAVRLLARLGELVFQRGTPFLPGGRLEIPDASGDIPPAVVWTEDPELAPFTTVFGAVQFVATLGVSLATLESMRASSTASILDQMRETNPLLVVGGPGLTW